ncbi:hypothetical protein KORDIASMS9_02217 [Kordia sp. SMS9]|uniref:hypothetical protein n=1 Tax=Kordia sp. SMS9 TaxID=2282170 RepID=UPI000E0DCC55|nr:hypothetical protein [Kordia sp. SMS9]AXG69988.1 hypothetical protein KORDIASMS9_02217 [Kordia sp. SMS9]
MKQHIFSLLVFIFFTPNISFSQEEAINLKRGDTIHKKIKLSFNETAVKENEYVIFEINDDFDFKNLILLINGKKWDKKTFKVEATNKHVSTTIHITPKKDVKSGNYNFNVKVLEASRLLENNIEYKQNKKQGFKHLTYVVPESFKESLIRYCFYGLIVIATFLMLVFFVRRNQKFKRGIISLKYPYEQEIHLKKYDRKFSYKYVVDADTLTDFYLTKGQNGNPKIHTTQENAMIEVNNEVVPNGYLLQMQDVIKVSNDNNDYIKFIYN